MAVFMAIQLVVTIVIGVYFYKQLRAQNGGTSKSRSLHQHDLDRLNKMRMIHLTQPLNETVRPQTFPDIIGQDEGIKALKALLCGKNPQHVLIYGPPGIGKTCAARLVLECAKCSAGTPFADNAPFIEIDATCVRFDERAIADPLIGSVHDPIYQGAGQLGVNGVPQPKEGAVTRANGGVLFLDEIGELHPTQMNKLLKVLEDRLVRFESAYYNPNDTNTPKHIHDIFKDGLPADFRLVGATTRSPEEISPALRSRCMEIYFRALEPDELCGIARGAADRAGFTMLKDDASIIGDYAQSGREAVNIVQMASGSAQLEERKTITRGDIEWVVECGRYHVRVVPRTADGRPGVVNGLAVQGSYQGAVMEIEAVVVPGNGAVEVTGIVEEEELGQGGRKIRRKSTARGAAENVRTVLRGLDIDMTGIDVHINFPGGMPVDGPSAGISMAIAAYSAITSRPIDGKLAMTGEISVRAQVRPVGGVPLKIAAATKAGLQRVIIPKDNWQERFGKLDIEVIPVKDFSEVLNLCFADTRSEVPIKRELKLVAEGAHPQSFA